MNFKLQLKKIILLFFFLSSFRMLACVCDSQMPISKEQFENYDVIFYGKVDSLFIESTGTAIVVFSVKELYKGNCEKEIRIIYDNSSSCMMTFELGAEWLIYASYQEFDKLKVHFCSHSRKLFLANEKDIYLSNAGKTFEEEVLFLQTNLGIQKLIVRNDLIKQQSDFKPHNEQPSGSNKIILLVVSLVIMIIVYVITKNRTKK